MNERIKELRKALGLSGEKFGASIGLTKYSVSNIENGRYNLTEANILAICREFNVNEDWLRNGNGEMFNAISSIPLDDLVKDLSPIEVDILKAYFSLDKDVRKKALEHFKKVLK